MSQTLRFTKMHGAGNDYVVIDGFEIRNDTGYGVKISAASDDPERTGSHVTVRNCRMQSR